MTVTLSNDQRVLTFPVYDRIYNDLLKHSTMHSTLKRASAQRKSSNSGELLHSKPTLNDWHFGQYWPHHAHHDVAMPVIMLSFDNPLPVYH